MNKIFKVYSKGYQTQDSDSIFSFFGRNEVGITKSISSLLYHDEEFLMQFISMLSLDIEIDNSKISIFAEQQSEIVDGGRKRRDITIAIQSPQGDNTLVVIEAKNPYVNNSNTINIVNQLNDYFDPNLFPDVVNYKRKIGVTLTRELIASSLEDQNYDNFYSITWETLVLNFQNVTFGNSITNSFITELKKVNFMKTYEKEIFCPPCGDSYNKIMDLGIYCCPFERRIQDSIYLMPRIGYNGYNDLLNPLDLGDNDYTGRGFCLNIFKIKDIFIVDSHNLEAIEDETLRDAVQNWLEGEHEVLKVFVLSEPKIFENPKFTAVQNSSRYSDVVEHLLPIQNEHPIPGQSEHSLPDQCEQSFPAQSEHFFSQQLI